MCGIFGTLNRPIDNPVQVLRDLNHRGPDAHGSLIVGPLSLLHTRLAIQELGVGGHQPMQYGQWALAFNGEIYNHRDLRRHYGLACQSGSDTETLLHLWERLGVAILPELDGMFALALFDTVTQRLWLARDRFGEKPLYVWQSGNELVFCSELRALQRHLMLSINRAALSRYCRSGYFFGDETPYQNVRMVRPGKVMCIDAQTLVCTETSWFSAMTSPKQAVIAENQLEQTLTHSVHQQLDTADREVGVLLSGGIDSGLITAIAAKHRPDIQTFTMSFANGSYDEAPLAQLVANQYKTRHTTIQIDTQNLADEVLTILPRYGEPFMDSSALPSYWVAKAARNQVSVVLTGDGADELFGGYRRYVAARFGLFQLPQMAGRLLGSIHSILPYPAHKQSRYSQLHRLIGMARQSGASRYLATTTDVFGGYESALIDPAPLDILEKMVEQTNSLSGLQQLQALDLGLLLPGDLLKKIDIATMANGLEARSPFLSREVAQFAFSMPDTLKIGWSRRGLETKFSLRQLAVKYLPSVLINQPKRGFEVPLRQWLDGPLRSLTHDYLARPSLIDSLVQPEYIRRLLAKPEQFPPEKRAKLLWMMLSVEIWHRNLFRHES